MSSEARTGTGSLAGDLVVHLAMIGGGVAFMLWMSSLSDVERQALVDRALNIVTFVLSAKIAMKANTPIAQRVFWSAAVFVLLACAVPATLSYWIYSALQ